MERTYRDRIRGEVEREARFLRKKECLLIDAYTGPPKQLNIEPSDIDPKLERLEMIEEDPEKRKDRERRLRHDIRKGPGGQKGLQLLLKEVTQDLRRIENFHRMEGKNIINTLRYPEKDGEALPVFHLHQLNSLVKRWLDLVGIDPSEPATKLNIGIENQEEVAALLQDQELRQVLQEIIEYIERQDEVEAWGLSEETVEAAKRLEDLGLVERVFSKKPSAGYELTEKGRNVAGSLQGLKLNWAQNALQLLKPYLEEEE